jgi:hypothetical protein
MLADAVAEKEEAIRTSESVEAEAKNAALSLRSYVDGCQEPERRTGWGSFFSSLSFFLDPSKRPLHFK